ncbi:MAG: 4Fe-4S dicluster domain-containing protein, partial [Ignavibacteriaceae bacterium]
MDKQNRRNFLKTAGLLTATISGVSTKSAKAAPENILSEDRMGVLVDTTVCIGCRNCEWACKKAHDLPTPGIETYDDKSVFKKMRRPDESALTVVNQYESVKDVNIPYNVKVQCMNCDHPACVSACIVGAMSKKKNGSVIWDTEKCIGCRYCLVA